MKVNLLQRGMPISEGKKVENITAKVNAEQKALFEAAREKTKELPKYKYPYTVISAAIGHHICGVLFDWIKEVDLWGKNMKILWRSLSQS